MFNIRFQPKPALLLALTLLAMAPLHAQTLVFDLENQVAVSPSEAKEQGRLSVLSLSKNGFSLDITRPGSAFDLVARLKGNKERRPESWGAVSLSSFFDYSSHAPLQINFSAPVSAFSIWMGDYSQDADDLELEAFSLPNCQGQSLGRTLGALKPQKEKFSFETLEVRAPNIRSVRVVAGSSAGPHSMYYDQLSVDVSPAPSGE